MPFMAKPPLVVIAGPTASGKSALAMRLAEKSGGVIINADSAQVYRELRVLSARPSVEEEAEVPHRLFGYRTGAMSCSAADWADDAKQAIADCHRAGQLPILVGGTGMYIRTLLDGIAPVPDIDPLVRERVRAMPVADSYAALLIEDPIMAARLRPSDTTRIARALEVVRSSGRSLAAFQAETQGGIADAVRVTGMILLPPRDWLHQRINLRFEQMCDQGALDEVRALLALHLPPLAPVMKAIGVPELARFLSGEIDLATAIDLGQAATRQYAKRQYAWFRHQPPAQWLRCLAQLDEGEMASNVILLQKHALTQ